VPQALPRAGLVVLGAVVSGVFLWLAVRNVDVELFWDALRDCDYVWLIPALGGLAVAVVIRAWRWQLLFVPESRPPLGAVTRALLVGQLFNVILPVRAGEAARIVVLHQETRTSRVEAVGTAVVERLYDVLALLLLVIAAAPFLPEVTWLDRAAVLAGVLLAVVAIGAVVVARFGARPVRVVLTPLAVLPVVTREHVHIASERLVLGLGALHRPRLVLPAFALSVLSWLVLAVSNWLVLVAFDLGLGYAAGVLILVTTTLSLVIPSAPGGIGVFEAGGVVALRAYGIDDSTALSVTVVLHALNVFPYVVAGAVVLHRHALRLRELQRSAAKPNVT
jgi:glycosyltransferase 2 family protein